MSSRLKWTALGLGALSLLRCGSAGDVDCPSDETCSAAGGEAGRGEAGTDAAAAGDGAAPLGGAAGSAAAAAGAPANAAAGAPAGAGGGPNEAGAAGAAGAGVVCGEPLFEQQPLSPGVHVTACSAVTYGSNPPSSGAHYPVWADFGVYDFALPRGYWVHNLEHGAVVVTYNCPEGCAQEVAAATVWLAGLAPDATCPAGRVRALLVPDPELDVRWAASSWGFTLRADCFESEAFTTFYAAHAGMPPAPEAIACGAGVDFRVDGSETCGVK